MDRTESPRSGEYQAGDLRIDTGRCQVSRQGETVPLTRLSFDLLVALVEAAPNVLTFDLMMERVWPGVVISPETVTQRIKVLRTALGDDPRSPRYIEGVRGRGYRWKTAVVPPLPDASASAGAAEVVETPEIAQTSVAPSRQHWPKWILVLLAVGVAALPLYLHFANKVEKQVLVERKVVTVSAAPPRSIAVLPFENLSSAPDGGIVALGMSEAVLHQLANLQQLTVIARTSSFAFQGRNEDVRDIARKLNTRYLLEGSVQSDRLRLRVTAELVDATTGTRLWSIRLDRNPQDLFAIQDEIATAVGEALKVSLASGRSAAGNHPRSRNIEAWLAFQQGRALMATRKIADLDTARQRFAQAIRLDPTFAAAYTAMAEAYVTKGFVPQSEFWLSSRPDLTPADETEAARLLGRALELDPNDGDAQLVRAWLQDDDEAAEPDYRHGIELSPNNAAGYAHFARVLFRAPGPGTDAFDPAKRQEALVMLDRAIDLDPLAPGNYLLKALMLSYGRSDWKQAIALCLQALEKDPNYYPALMKLAEFKWAGSGELAEAARYAEEALVIEPQALWLRHMLSRIYLDLHDFDAARSVIEERHEPDLAAQVPLAMYRHDWRRVAQLTSKLQTNIPGDMELLSVGMVRARLTTGQPPQARTWIQESVGLQWAPDGAPVFTVRDFSKETRVSLARMMISDGDIDRGHRVLRAALHEMDHDAFDLGRGDNWFSDSRAEALALLGDYEGAIEALRRGCAAAFMFDQWYRLEDEPAFATLRADPRFRALVENQHEHIEHERTLLRTMRAEGLVLSRAARPHQ